MNTTKKVSQKELARQFRHEAYPRAKKLLKTDPHQIAMAEKVRELRRKADLKAKEQDKAYRAEIKKAMDERAGKKRTANMSNISKQELIQLQKTLGRDVAIGKKFGVTRQAVHQMRKKYGIESRYFDNSERNASIIEQYKKGLLGVSVLAKKHALSIPRVYKIIQRAGGGEAYEMGNI